MVEILTPLYQKWTDPASRKSVKNTVELNSTNKQLGIIVIYRPLRPLNPITAEYIFFSSSHGTFTKVDHTLAIKQNLAN